MVSNSEGPEEAVWEKELMKTVNSFLAALPAEKRNLFVCRYWYVDSIKDMAERFGMTENNVSVTLNRLRKQLHSYLIERGFEL